MASAAPPPADDGAVDNAAAAAASVPPHAALARALSAPDWAALGRPDEPATATAASDDPAVPVARTTALLVVRVAARVMELQLQAREADREAEAREAAIQRQREREQRRRQREQSKLDTGDGSGSDSDEEPRPWSAPSSYLWEDLPFPECNWSTTSICDAFLEAQSPWPFDDAVLAQTEALVRALLAQYDPAVPYHNAAHAAHVTVSANKLLDLLWAPPARRASAFGLRQDALGLMALVFAAIVHDVEHRGLPNRQLALEGDDLAVLYNDNSIAEQRSLCVAFRELLKPDYVELRRAVFPTPEEYRDFRQKVVDLVLNTDIASPERTQLAKSKYMEAFGPIAAPNQPGDHSGASRVGDESATEDDAKEAPPNSVKMKKGASFRSAGRTATTTGDDPGARGVPVEEPPKSYGRGLMGSMSAMGRSLKRLSSRRLPVEDSSETEGNASESTLPSAADIMQKYTVKPVKKTVKLVAGSLGSIKSSLGLSKPKKLGIRLSMDLTGETVEHYRTNTRRASMVMVSEPNEEIDELKAAVLLELMMTVADVGQNLQGYEQMCEWAGRLYNELRKAFLANRGADPKPNWFQNQIGFLEFYLLPLAQRLNATRAFGSLGLMFEEGVKMNLERWLVEGAESTNNIIENGFAVYPGNDEWLEYLIVSESDGSEDANLSAQHPLD